MGNTISNTMHVCLAETMNIEYTCIDKYWEFFKKIGASTFSGFRQFLSLVTVKPAVEKSLSLGC